MKTTKNETRNSELVRAIFAFRVSIFALFLLVAGCGSPATAQDPGSMASKVNRPGTCSDAQVLKYNNSTGQYECQNEAGGGGLPSGTIVLIVSGSCPSGFVEETSLNGKTLFGTLAPTPTSAPPVAMTTSPPPAPSASPPSPERRERFQPSAPARPRAL